MGVVSEVLGNYGAPHVIEHEGKQYRLKLIDQVVKSAFEKARFVKAKEALSLIKDTMTPDEYSASLKGKTDLYEAGEYEIFSESGMAHIRTVAGMRLLLSLIIDCTPNELMGLILAKKDELVPMLSLVLRESFPGLKMEASEAQAESVPSADTKTESPAATAPVPNG